MIWPQSCATVNLRAQIFPLRFVFPLKPVAPLKLDGYKVVNGERIFMGTLQCDYDSAKKTLACTFRGRSFDDWQFTLSGTTLQGTLTVDAGKTLFRKITVSKKLAR